MDTQSQQLNFNKFKTKTIGTKLALLVLILPAAMLLIAIIGFLCSQRSNMQQTAQDDIADKWGKEQTLIAPFLIANKIKSDSKEVIRKRIYLPNALDVNAELTPEIRYRGIYQRIVYTGCVQIKAKFKSYPDIDTSYIGVSSSDIDSISNIKATINGTDVEISYDPIEKRFLAKVPLNYVKKDLDISLTISLRGSKKFSIDPIGQTNKIKISANWNSPSFIGQSLPTKRSITDTSFTADWDISSLTTHYPKTEVYLHKPIKDVGVNLFVPIDIYSQVERALTYSFLFITMFVVSLLFAECITKMESNITQYIIAICGPIIFYLLLLSFAEHIGFTPAFVLAAAMTSILVSTYVGVVLNSKKAGWGILVSLGISYILTFVLLRLENMALLVGSLVLFFMLTLVMTITAKLNR
ncbi:MAG: cell envelope integrity protein CreD [Verrucomicrobiaceae bacterium]|nr:cell envelope integrity protein CreD [Verrucomicrobiaceae bacterium]